MTKSYIGVAPLTMLRTVPPGYVSVHQGDPVPENAEPADLKRLVDEGFLAESEKFTDEGGSGDAAPTSVKGILEVVGDDKAKAQEYLDAEQAKGDDARGSLVEKLQKVLEA